MLFPESTFKGFINHTISDTKIGNEMLINIDAESREEVEKMAETVRLAGGIIYAETGESGAGCMPLVL